MGGENHALSKGIFAKGILGGTGFPFCGGRKGLRLPLAVSKKGSETPSFLMLRPRERGSLRPFFFPTARGSLRPFFPPQKGKPRTSQNPPSENRKWPRSLFRPVQARSWKERSGAGWDQAPPRDLDGSEMLENKAHGESGRDPFGPGMGPGRAQDRTQARVWMAPPETVTDF